MWLGVLDNKIENFRDLSMKTNFGQVTKFLQNFSWTQSNSDNLLINSTFLSTKFAPQSIIHGVIFGNVCAFYNPQQEAVAIERS